MTAGRSGNNGNDAAKRESSETEFENRSLLRKPELPCCFAGLLEQFHDIETAIESFTASSPMELPAPAAPPPGAIGTALTRRKWLRFSPP